MGYGIRYIFPIEDDIYQIKSYFIICSGGYNRGSGGRDGGYRASAGGGQANQRNAAPNTNDNLDFPPLNDDAKKQQPRRQNG